MKNRSNIHFLLIILAFLFFSCTTTTFSLWQSESELDTKASSNRNMNFDNNSNLYYNISNDLKNLYFHIETSDTITQMKILHSGIQLWIDTTGKRQQRVGILFPFENILRRKYYVPAAFQYISLDQIQYHDLKFLKNRFLENDLKEVHVIGFRPPIAGIIPLANTYGIIVNVRWDSSNIMTYSALIPFNTFYKKSLCLSDSTKIFGISIELSSYAVLPRPEKALPDNMSNVWKPSLDGHPIVDPETYSTENNIRMKFKLAIGP